jgi:hypothetical protein
MWLQPLQKEQNRPKMRRHDGNRRLDPSIPNRFLVSNGFQSTVCEFGNLGSSNPTNQVTIVVIRFHVAEPELHQKPTKPVAILASIHQPQFSQESTLQQQRANVVTCWEVMALSNSFPFLDGSHFSRQSGNLDRTTKLQMLASV